MGLSYNGLWKILIDKGIKKMGLKEQVGISTNTLSKLSKNEPVALTVLEKICESLDCQIGDIVEYVPNNKDS